jgi:hypothetical protein
MPKRKYDNIYPSVTQVLDCLRKPGLEYWFKVNTPEYIKSEGDKAKEIGTQTHEAIQSYIETGKAKVDTKYPEEVTMALNSFMLFRKEHPNIVLEKSEIQLTSHKYKYNGTIDCIAEDEKGVTIIADWKTGRAKDKESPTIWDEHKYQVSAYVNLWNEYNGFAKGQGVQTAIIVCIAKDKVAYDWYVMDRKEIDQCFKNVFLPALKICSYQRKK